MKNFKVKAIKKFTDYEGLEIIPTNPHVEREIGDTFYCDSERAEFLVNKGAVEIIKAEKALHKEEKTANADTPKETKKTSIKKTRKNT